MKVGRAMGAPAPNPAGTPMQSWLELWSEWEIQTVVAVSFSAQVILFFFAGIRCYSVSSVLRVFLWLVYLTADAAAIYALGHMSASLSKTSTDKHQLVAFWAPLLLLHLGGQDTITAYAMEDNKLWLRHLLTMSVQVAGTGYVLHKYIIADSATIVSAAVLVSVAGFVKYSERIWALKCASKGLDEDYRDMELMYDAENCFTRIKKFRTYELIVRIAHLYLSDYVKPIIIDRYEEVSPIERSHLINKVTGHVDELLDQGDVSAREKRYAEEVYRVIEVQLALAYDMLYTKAQVIHTWYGYLIRVISFVSCFGGLVAFTRSRRDRYSTPDIVITFVLLGGACALEVTSAFKMIGSTYTYAMINGYRWTWLASAILFTRYHLIVVKEGRWSNSAGQYNFIAFCGRYRPMFGCFWLQDWWNKAHYTRHAKLSPALKEFVWGMLPGEKSSIVVQIEDVAFRSGYWARRLTGFSQSEELDWSLRMEFHNCVFIWHIATSTFLSNPAVKSELVVNGMAEAVNTLSDYMMYLLVQHPDILPMNAAARRLFRQTYNGFLYHWNESPKSYTRDVTVDMPHEIILDFMELRVGLDVSKKPKKERLRELYNDMTKGDSESYPGIAELMKASILVRTLLRLKLELTHKLVIIGRVWTEILFYAAVNASGDFHARQLSNGGEFLTHMLFLKKYCSSMPKRLQFPCRAADDQTVEVSLPGEPTVDVGDHVELNVDTDSEEDISAFRYL